MYGHKYTEAERHFFEEYVPGHSYFEIQQAFIKKFGWEITIGQVKSYIGNHHLNTGRTGYFKKGNIPSNKGKKISAEAYEKAKGTMFKKGNVPHNYRPVGSERINKDGYTEVKVKDPRTWKLKHRLIWEQHNGAIPKGYIAVFKDNNKQNLDINNLLLIKKSENLILNNTGLCQCNGETKEIAVNIAKLKLATSKKKRRSK